MSSSDDIRPRSIELLTTSLQSAAPGADPNQLSQLASEIEEALFLASDSDSGNTYRSSIRDRSLVLKKDNPGLAKELLSGSSTAQTFATASPQDLRSSQQVAADSQLEQDHLQEAMAPSEPEALSEQKSMAETRPLEEAQPGAPIGEDGTALGEEGEFKERSQPRVGRAMEGVEFETAGV